MNCSQCGAQHSPEARFCPRCGAPLSEAHQDPPPPPPVSVEVKDRWIRDGEGARRYAQGKNAFVATLLAFIPTAGQLYNGDYKKAGAIVVGFIVCFVIASTLLGAPLAGFIWFFIWLWSIFDAYRTAKRDTPLW